MFGTTKAQEKAKQNPWYDYNIENNEKLLNETIITLRLTKKHYKTGLYSGLYAWTEIT